MSQMKNTDFAEGFYSVNSEVIVKTENEMKEELEDPVPQGLCQIKMEEGLEREAGEEDMNDSTVEPIEAVDPLAYSGDRYFSCLFCSFATPAPNVLREHILNRRGNQCPVSCSQCTFSCRELSSLREHMHSWHGEELPSPSPASSHSADLINLPIQTPHSTNRPLSCPHCEYTLPHPNDLKVHIKERHTPARAYSCPHCEYTTSQKAYLKIHIKARHLSDRSHSCPHCQFKTAYPTSLKAHIKTLHSTDRPHSCPPWKHICDSPYARRYTSRHLTVQTVSSQRHSTDRPQPCPPWKHICVGPVQEGTHQGTSHK